MRPINISNQFKFSFGKSVITPIFDREEVSRFAPSHDIAFVAGPTNLSNGATLICIPSRFTVHGIHARKYVQINYQPFPYDESTSALVRSKSTLSTIFTIWDIARYLIIILHKIYLVVSPLQVRVTTTHCWRYSINLSPVINQL